MATLDMISGDWLTPSAPAPRIDDTPPIVTEILAELRRANEALERIARYVRPQYGPQV